MAGDAGAALAPDGGDQRGVVGAIIATSADSAISKGLGFVGVMLVSVNIFGGFLVTQRMLGMFKKKQK